MVVLMTAAAVWGVLQLFVLAWPARSVRLATTLFAFALGVYGCGFATALVELAYTRAIADQSGRALADVVRTTSYTVAPWVEEIIKVTPLLLAGLHVKVRRQWGITDFVVLGAALGAGFGLLESVLRYGLDAHRAIARDGGWVIPDSLSPPFVPGPAKVFTSWLPSPAGSIDLGQAATVTFSHLVWTAIAGLGVGLLWRTRGGWRLASVLPVAAAIIYHTLNNYSVRHPVGQAQDWLESLDGKAWAIPLACLAVAMVLDLRDLIRAKRTVPGVLLAAERDNGDTPAALIRYAAWRLPFSALIALRFIRLRRSLYYAAAVASPEEAEPLRRVVAQVAARIDDSDHEEAWRAVDLRAHLKAARARAGRRRWLLLIPALLALPSLVFLGVGSFKSTAELQHWVTAGPRPRILLWFALAALAWVCWQLVILLRMHQALLNQPLAEPLAAVGFRVATALGTAAAGTLLLWRGLGDAGPAGDAIPAAHLLEALGQFLIYLGILLFLLSLFSFLSPGGLVVAYAGGGAAGGLVSESVAVALGRAGIILLAVGAGGLSGGDFHAWPRSSRKGPTKPKYRADVKGDEGKPINGSKSQGHTIKEHVNKTTQDLRARLRKNPDLEADSRYIDEASAQRFTDETLLQNQKVIEKWLNGGKGQKLTLQGGFKENTGLRLTRANFKNTGQAEWVKGTKVILKRDPGAPSGYRVLTSYPYLLP